MNRVEIPVHICFADTVVEAEAFVDYHQVGEALSVERIIVNDVDVLDLFDQEALENLSEDVKHLLNYGD